MSARENFTHIEGNLVATPELRYTPSGVAVTTLTVANSDRRRNDAGEWVDTDPSYFDVVVWERLAEASAQSFSKGDRVCIDGRLNQRSWETDAGDRRYKIEIVADSVSASLRFAASVNVNKRAFEGTAEPTKMTSAVVGGYATDEEPF